jgi:hypothetical protein
MALLQERYPDSGREPALRDLTVRSMALGAAMVVFVNVGAPYAKYILHSSLMACDYLPFGVMLPFILAVLVLNPLLKTFRSTLGLTPGELAVAFVMALVGSTIPTFGLTGYLISTIASPYYNSTTENGWGEYIQPNLPGWLIPSNDTGAMTWFFEGLPPGQSIPWGIWFPPLFWWLGFFAALMTVCFCTVAILRRQWIDNERIVFPLAQVPLMMIEGSDGPGRMPAFMKGSLFWIGFAIPVVIIMWNVVGYFLPTFPTIALNNQINLLRDAPAMRLNIYFPLIGFAYLINLDVAFSIWFFHLLGIAQLAVTNRFGFEVGKGDNYCSSSPVMAWQGFGGFIVLVSWGLWMARAHLRDVFAKAFGRAPEVDDRAELLSYRVAALGLIVGMGYVVAFLIASGMSPLVVLAFLFSVFVLYLGVTRIVIEGGLVFLRGPMIAQHFTVYALGVTAISPVSMAALSVSYAWFCDVKSFFMPAAAHAAKLGDVLKLRRSSVIAAVVSALVIGVGTSMVYTLQMGYANGAYNFGDWIFRGGSLVPYDAMVSKMRNPFDVGWDKLGVMLAGMAVMAGVTFLRYRFNWWPLHPLGFPVAFTLPVRLSFFSIFIAWAAKSLILRFGGIALYRKAEPFFYGLIVGFFLATGISFLIDMIWFPGQGHLVYGW